MKQQFNLSINSPCSENFSNFQPTAMGGFCAACQKNIVDFTQMSEDEIQQYFKNSTGKTCGRFKTSQLKTYSLPSTRHRRHNLQWVGTGLLGLTLLVTGNNSTAEPNRLSSVPVEIHPEETINKVKVNRAIDHTVKGTVVDEYGEVLPGVNILIKGTAIGTVTDIDGRFVLHDVNEGDVLVFSFIGFISTEHKIGKEVSEVIEMKMIEMEMDIMGEVAIDDVYSSKPTLWERVKAIFQ